MYLPSSRLIFEEKFKLYFSIKLKPFRIIKVSSFKKVAGNNPCIKSRLTMYMFALLSCISRESVIGKETLFV